MKRLTFELRKQIESDLGLNIPFVKGRDNPVKNCWHFSTDGNAVDEIFYCELDFIDGMNRIWIVSRKFDIIILAFSLMDTHVHFILYGTLEECRRFMHEYMRRTSQYIAHQHGDKNKLDGVPINYQEIDTDFYLKTAICYTLRNAPVGGLPYTAWNYPWSSGPLYFCQKTLGAALLGCNVRRSQPPARDFIVNEKLSRQGRRPMKRCPWLAKSFFRGPMSHT